MHGFAKDAYAWFDRSDTSTDALPAKLFKLGYDPWLFSVRGTRYSITHEDYDARRVGADQYWNYDFEDVAKGDVTAIIKKIVHS